MCSVLADSHQFAAFVDDQLDGDHSEVENLTDDDDLDADPTFTLISTIGNNEEAAEDTSSSEDEPENIPGEQVATTGTNPSDTIPGTNISTPTASLAGTSTSTTVAISTTSSMTLSAPLTGRPTSISATVTIPRPSRTTPTAPLTGTSCTSATVAIPSTSSTTTTAKARNPGVPIAPTNRVFWKKVITFDPLPPAPDHEPLALNAINFAPHTYVSKYIPDNIFALLTEHTTDDTLKKRVEN